MPVTEKLHIHRSVFEHKTPVVTAYTKNASMFIVTDLFKKTFQNCHFVILCMVGRVTMVKEIWVGQLKVSYQEVAFLPSQANVSTTFLKNSGGCVSLRTTTCPTTLVAVNKGMPTCKIPFLHEASFCVRQI